MTEKPDPDIARAGRQAALAIAGGGLLAIFAPGIVRVTGLPVRYEFLLYFISIACFIWALSVAARMWQKRDK